MLCWLHTAEWMVQSRVPKETCPPIRVLAFRNSGRKFMLWRFR